MSELEPKPSEPASRDAARRSPSTVIERLRGKARHGDRYAAGDEIARGGMGAIVRVWDTELQRHLAMKVMLAAEGDAASSASAAASEGRRIARFLDEAHITGQLDHPGIVPVHEIGLDDRGQLFFTMRLIKGRELREVFELVHKGDEGWNLTRALGVVLKVCEAMAFAHEKGVIHRDLKPANVMVGRFGEVYVMDWGLAKVVGREDVHDLRIAKPDVSRSVVRSARAGMEATPESPLSTMDGDIVGTPCYMAPEQARGRVEDIGPHSDIYSVGSMLYELLGGEKPYCVGGTQPSPSAVLGALMHGPPRALDSIKKDIPDELVAIAEKAMARDPRDRYATMLVMADDLRAFLEGRVVAAYETGPVAEFKKWIARNKGVAAAIAAAILVALVGVFVAFSLQRMANVELAAANSVIEDRNANLQEQEKQTRVAYEQLREATNEQERINRALQAMTAQAQTNATLAQRRGYAASIAAADGSLRFGDVADVRQHLDKCEADLRGWEWRHLSSRCDDSTRAFELGTRVSAVAASRDGRVIACGVERDGAFGVELLDARSGEKLSWLKGHEQAVTAVAFDSRGKRVATICVDRRGRVFDADTGALVTSWAERTGMISCLAFAPNAAQVLSVGNDDVPRLRDAETGAIVREYGKLASRSAAVCFAPDGAHFAIAARDGMLSIYDTASGALDVAFGNREAPIFAIAFDGDGERLLSGGGHSTEQPPPRGTPPDHALRVWDARTGELLGAWPNHEQRVSWVAFGDDGRTLLSASLDRTVRTIDLASGVAHTLVGHARGIVAASLLGDSRHVVTASSDGSLRVWEPDLAELLAHAPQRGNVLQLAFSNDGHLLIAAHDEGLLCAYDVRTGIVRWHWAELCGGLSARVDNLRSFAVSASDVIAVGSGNGVAFLVAAQSGDQLARLEMDSNEAVTSVAFSRNGARLAAGSSLGTIRVFDVASRQLVRTLRGSKGSVGALAWTPDGARIVAATSESTLVVWDVDQETRTEVAGDIGTVFTLDFEPTSAALLAAGSDTLHLFGRDLGEAPIVLPAPGVVAAAFLENGRRFVTCNQQGFVTIHDAERGDVLLTLRRDASQGSALACERAGQSIAAGFGDGAIRVWSAAPLREIADLRSAALRARELALPLVDAALERGATREAALAEFRGNEAISDALRDAAVSWLTQCSGRASFLRDESWAVARRPNLPAADYRLALWQALTVEALQPDDYRAIFVEGAARYRLGQFELAGAELERALAMHSSRRFEPEMAGFVVLNQLALGRRDAIEAPLAELRSLMSVSINLRSVENLALLQEVEAEIAHYAAQ